MNTVQLATVKTQWDVWERPDERSSWKFVASFDRYSQANSKCEEIRANGKEARADFVSRRR